MRSVWQMHFPIRTKAQLSAFQTGECVDTLTSAQFSGVQSWCKVVERFSETASHSGDFVEVFFITSPEGSATPFARPYL